MARPTGRAFIVALGRPTELTVEMVVAEPAAVDAFGIMVGEVDSPHRTGLGRVWLAGMEVAERDAFLDRIDQEADEPKLQRTAVARSIASIKELPRKVCSKPCSPSQACIRFDSRRSRDACEMKIRAILRRP